MSTTVLTGIVKTTRTTADGCVVEEFVGTGDPARNVLVDTVAARFRDLPPMLLLEQPVTFLRYGRTMLGVPVISLDEGRLYVRDGKIVCLPKGRRTRGYRLEQANILALTGGFNQGDALRAILDGFVRELSDLTELTQDDLAGLPNRGNNCTLAAVGTSPFFGSDVPGVWLLHSYIAEDDIAEGVFVVADGHGAVTEHGSVYGRDLLRRFAKAGRVDVPLAEALDYTFDQALQAHAVVG